MVLFLNRTIYNSFKKLRRAKISLNEYWLSIFCQFLKKLFFLLNHNLGDITFHIPLLIHLKCNHSILRE